jgi:hypothetical protein
MTDAPLASRAVASPAISIAWKGGTDDRAEVIVAREGTAGSTAQRRRVER